jgi:predicted phage gp36 major capsid-like protein
MENKQAYREKLEAQMREWSAKIDLLKAKADQAEADAKIEYRNRIEDLRQKKEALKAKLGELQNASDAAWKDIRAGAEKAAADLKDALQSALAKFKQ